MATKLSARAIDAAKPLAKPYELRDSDLKGLLVRIQPSGVRTFYVELARGARERIGPFPVVTVDAARTQALAKLAEFQKTGVRSVRKSKVLTLRKFVEEEFQPWATANLKWGDGAADRILSVFSEFADKPLTAINAWTIEKWRSKRIKAGTAPNTCNRDLATLKSALARAVKWKMLEADPLADVKQSKVDSSRVRYLTSAEDKRLRAALTARDAEGRAARARANAWRLERRKATLPALREADYADHLTPAVLVSINTGLRRGELMALTWDDINLPAKLLTVRAAAAKSGKARHVPLNTEATAALKQWKKQAGDGKPFPFRDLKTAWSALLTTAKIEGFRWHDLRHTFASQLVMAGVNLNAVRELLGHADLKMTLRYAHLAPSHLADAVAKLGGK